MLQTNKYWILERLSFYIGIILYTVYTGIVIWKNSRGDYSQYDLEIVEGVLGARFIAFLLEEFVDIAIDGELHNDLSKLQKIKEDPVTEKKVIVKIEEENTSETEAIEHEVENKNKKVIYSGSIIELKKYMDVSNFVAMPNSVNYYGSFFAWFPYSVFNDPEQVWMKKNDKFPRVLVVFLCIIPLLVTFFLCLTLIIFCIVATLLSVIVILIIIVIIGLCCCAWNKRGFQLKNFLRELTHF